MSGARSLRRVIAIHLCLVIGWFAAPLASASEIRIKDLVEFDGVRGNDLVGYGLVVGLPGSGDGLRNSPFTEEALSNLLERLGINVTGEQFRPKNVAAVLVTAELPAFARAGSRIDVSVSAIGDANSLRGGTLIMTPLNAADGRIYAVAQGPVLAGGVVAQGEAETVTRGVPTGGVIPDGGRVELELDFELASLDRLRLALRDPDFTTASRIAAAINRSLRINIARMQDSGTVVLDTLDMVQGSTAEIIARIENLRVATDQKARVVIDQRSGTIVLGDDVRIDRVAISQGDLTLRIRETPIVVQPSPFGQGETVVVPRTNVEIEETGEGIAIIDEAVSLAELVEGLNALGVSTRQMIDILSAIKAAGAVHAEFILQ
ncbi:MAG: flagellar basal body P-ring protein FlgI [Pseudomonadota bacterium]